jgi:U32 family peptidase
MRSLDIAPELLAPAGSVAIAESAFDHGADAVYVGFGQENLRAHAPALLYDDLRALLDLAHSRGKKVYVTLNCMPDDAMLTRIQGTVAVIAGMPRLPHAVIVSDPGVLTVCRKAVPAVAVHLSTQTGVFNAAALRFWREQGVTRIILPRELTLEQVGALAAEQGMEAEVFVHGAMCVSVSGRCLLGAYIDGRHPNKGDCTQPCRLRYRIDPIDPFGTPADRWFEAEESAGGVFLMNSKDLCGLSILPATVKTGVHALKIEGRNKGMHYVATVTRVYRAALDACMADPSDFSVRKEWLTELETVEHRPYTTGFYRGELHLQSVFASKSEPTTRMAGIIKGVLPDGAPVIDVRGVFRAGERLQILPVNRKIIPYEIRFSSLSDLAGIGLDFAPLNRLVVGRGGAPGLRPGDLLRKV